MKCADVMTKNPAYCLPTDTVQKAAELMRARDVGPIPVVDDTKHRRLIGILTDRDLVVHVMARHQDPVSTRVADVMSRDPATSLVGEDLDSALDTMIARKVRRVPVVDEHEQLVGIIAQADVARAVEEPDKLASVVQAVSTP